MTKENILRKVTRCSECGAAYEAHPVFDDGKCESCGDYEDDSISPHTVVYEKDYRDMSE